MKNLIIIALLFCASAAFSQIQKGTLVVGGGLNFAGNNAESQNQISFDRDHNQANFDISGSYEKFLGQSTAAGLFLGYTYSSQKGEFDVNSYPNNYDYKQYMITAGPQMSNYVTISQRLYFTVLTRLSLGIGMGNDKVFEEKTNIWSIGLSASPGLAFFLNDSFALSAGIGNIYYSYRSEKSQEENANGETAKHGSHQYGLSFNVNTFTIGLRYFLRTAKTE